MKLSLGKYVLTVLLAGFAMVGVSGCSSQVTHHSGQIGRYYGDGVSFSVPVVQKATEVQQEDKFWEVRQGIGGADVVVLGPFVTHDGGESFRENMTLSSQAVSGIADVAQFRQQQIEALKKDIPSASSFVEGQDDSNVWVDYECTEKNKQLACRAYFFLDTARSLGYVLVGTVHQSPKVDEYRHDFDTIAKTFRIGTPLSACECLSEVLTRVVALNGNSTPQEAPAPANATEEVQAPVVEPEPVPVAEPGSVSVVNPAPVPVAESVPAVATESTQASAAVAK